MNDALRVQEGFGRELVIRVDFAYSTDDYYKAKFSQIIQKDKKDKGKLTCILIDIISA